MLSIMLSSLGDVEPTFRVKVRSALRSLQSARAFSRAYNALVLPFLSKPYQSPCMEVTYGAWAGVFSLRDVSGRQLGEDNVTPLILRASARTQWQEWKLKDSRRGRLFNQTAIQQVLSCWPAVIGLASAVRGRFLAAHPSRGPRLTPRDLFVVAHALTAIPAWMVRRSRDSFRDLEVPVVIAAAYKAAAGVHFAIRHMLAVGHEACSMDSVLSAEEIYRYIDEHELLISPTGRVCSGPKHLITEFLRALIDGGPCADDMLATLRGDVDAYFRYSMCAARMEFATMLHCLSVAEVMAEHLRREEQRGSDLSVSLRHLLHDYSSAYDARDNRARVILDILDTFWPSGSERGMWQPDPSADSRLEMASRLLGAGYGDLRPILARFLEIERKALPVFRARQKELGLCLGRDVTRPVPYHALKHRVVARYVSFLRMRLGVTLREKEGDLHLA